MSRVGIIILILVLGIVVRFFAFGQIPAGISDDEASHGYNAMSLLQTGRDEYGKSWPIFIRSFGTYASSLYTYMTVPIVGAGQLDISTTRLTSVVAGTILVLLACLINPVFGLVIAISPVFVFYSRAAFETNLALMLIFLGLVVSLRSLTSPNRLLVGFALISLSAYAYHAQRFLSLLLLAGLVYFLKSRVNKYTLIKAVALAVIIQIPIFAVSLTPGSSSRVTSLQHSGSVGKKIIDAVFLASTYFSPNNLFSRPDPAPRKSFSDVSVFYWWMVVPAFSGGLSFLKKDKTNFEKSLIILGLGSVIVASTTKDYFSTWRALPMFVTYAYIISLGMARYTRWVLLALILFSLATLYSNLVLQKHEQSVTWSYPYKQIAEFTQAQPSSQILIDNTRAEPLYVWIAFYRRDNPLIIQNQFDANWLSSYYKHVDYEPISNLGNIQIRPIEWTTDVYKNQIIIADHLAISPTQAQEHFLELLTQFTNINNRPVMSAYKTHPQEKCTAMAIRDPLCL